MKRSFPQQTILSTNTSQPIFCTTFAGTVTASSAGAVSVQVASSAGFLRGDFVHLSPGTVRSTFAKVISVPDGTHLLLSETNKLLLTDSMSAHSNGDYISLALSRLFNVYLQRVANDTNLLVIGLGLLDPGATPPIGVVATVVGAASGAQPEEFSDPNPCSSLGAYWVYGAQGTVYNLSVTVL